MKGRYDYGEKNEVALLPARETGEKGAGDCKHGRATVYKGTQLYESIVKHHKTA